MTNFHYRKICFSALGALILIAPMITVAQEVSELLSATIVERVSIPRTKSQVKLGAKYYISADNLKIRSSNTTDTEKNIVGKLSLNDEVYVIDVLGEDSPLVEIKIARSSSVNPQVAPSLFVSKDYLSEKEVGGEVSKYFVIQNIASEKTRVYERCTETPSCPHKLIMETDMVVGRPETGTDKDPYAFVTWLGHAKIANWVKFYQDGAAHYPPWYTEGQSLKTIPSPITDGITNMTGAGDWKVENEHGDESIYGAFGWYAAKLTPEDDTQGVNYQWIHGTIGWGKDGAAAIELTRNSLMNLFSDPGSSGCTRLENRAVAYLRTILPPGTDIYRVYAKEATREQEGFMGASAKKLTIPLSRYADKFNKPLVWNFILLTNGAQESNGLTADAQTIIDRAIPVVAGKNLIERGTYLVDQYPNAVKFHEETRASSGKSGDRYEIDADRGYGPSNFNGFFLVDEGRFVAYEHPDTIRTKGIIRIGGLPDFRKSVPEFLRTSGTFNLPK